MAGKASRRYFSFFSLLPELRRPAGGPDDVEVAGKASESWREFFLEGVFAAVCMGVIYGYF